MRRGRIVTIGVLGAALFVGIATACSVDVDVSNKACPCGDDYVCDTARNVCVRPDELTAAEAGLDDGGAGDGGRVPCADDKCPCATNADCKDPARSKCSADEICVECVVDPQDTCPVGSYCNDQHQCTLGCKQESDCQISPSVPHCNTINHTCVECTQGSQCGDAGLVCSPSGTCVEGCDLSQGLGCPSGKTCCDKYCLDTKTDRLNCGACGTACSTANGTPSCANGACTWSCALGFKHCAQGNSGCETNVRTDVANCGGCGTSCAALEKNVVGPYCNSGSCNYAACTLGFGNCNFNFGDGCECACGSVAGEICCPGNICNYDGGKCAGNGKCQ